MALLAGAKVAYRTELAIMERAQQKQLALYDTLTRSLRPVVSLDGEGYRIYCCGPTVYRDAHVGNLRTFLLADIVRRTLLFLGKKVTVVQNITDVGHMSEDFEEDKMLTSSRIEKRDPFAIARDYESKFHEDCLAINISRADHNPRASESIDLMIDHISRLIADGYAYQGSDGSIYFAAEKFDSYGELSGNRLDALKPGHRYEYTEGGAKRFHADWALWKNAGSRIEMIWDTPWGRGFPGWHIECSAMSLHYLRGHIDLHIGGIDLRFPHHENERAQSNVVTGDEAVSLWLHGEHLLFEGRKMSKSAGNVVLVKTLRERGLDPLSLRFALMENRYRSQMDLSWASLDAAHDVLRRWRGNYQRWKSSDAIRDEASISTINSMIEAFCNDLDTPRAMIILRGIERNKDLSDGQKRAIFEDTDQLFGLDLLRSPETPPLGAQVEELLRQRDDARRSKDFAQSDRLRDQISEFGITVKDTADGQVWEYK